MANEWLLVINLVVCYGLVVLWHTLFGRSGLIAFTAIIMVLANIEVNIMIVAFGLEQTLGNIMFAASFLITDILSELYGKKEADKAVNIGILASVTFVMISQLWLLYTPSGDGGIFDNIVAVFKGVPRIILASLVVNIVCQKVDVLLYHALWKLTTKLSGSSHKYLWVRNNCSTLTSQLLNTVLFSFAAFYGTVELNVIGQIILSSYIIFIFTSLLDTPVIYLVRKLYERKQAKKENAVVEN